VPKSSIAVLVTGDPVPSVEERRGPFVQMFRDALAGPGQLEPFDARRGEFPELGAHDLLVITGSAANVPTRETWIVRTEAWLREVTAAGTPTLGVCFGHQLLAQALGGEVVRNPRGREIGTRTIELRTLPREDEWIFEGVGRSFEANVTHVDTVGRLPPGATSLARSDLEEHHAIRFSETCYGVQFHPEIDAEIMRGYLESRREVLAAEGFDVDGMIEGIREGEPGRRVLRNFVARFGRR